MPPHLVPQKSNLESDTLPSFPLKQSQMAACANRPFVGKQTWCGLEEAAWGVRGDLPDVNYL